MGVKCFAFRLPDGNPHRRVLIVVTHLSRRNFLVFFASAPSPVLLISSKGLLRLVPPEFFLLVIRFVTFLRFLRAKEMKTKFKYLMRPLLLWKGSGHGKGAQQSFLRTPSSISCSSWTQFQLTELNAMQLLRNITLQPTRKLLQLRNMYRLASRGQAEQQKSWGEWNAAADSKCNLRQINWSWSPKIAS